MKLLFKISFSLLTIVFLSSCAIKMYPINPQRFEKIIEVPNVSQIDLYIRANEWFIRNFTNAESVIQFQDREEGRIIGRYVSDLPATSLFVFNKSSQVISIDVRDNRVRLVITDPCVASGRLQNGLIVFGACTNRAIKRTQLALLESWESLAHSLEQFLNIVDSW